MGYQLKNEYVEEIKNDPILFGLICKAMEAAPSTVLTWCRGGRGKEKLTLAAVIFTIRKYKGMPKSAELIEETTETKVA